MTKDIEILDIFDDENDNDTYNYGYATLYESDFAPAIVERGLDYYNNGHVIRCNKVDEDYYAIVKGKNEYQVAIYIDDDELIDYECTCPCEYPCKHIYATLLAIDNQEYNNYEFKPYISEEMISFTELLGKIPAKELKAYLISLPGSQNITINNSKLIENFIKYVPKQSYEFYYNNLYNACLRLEDYQERIKNNLTKAKIYIDNGEYKETFKIVKSIISVIGEIVYLNNENTLDLILKLGVYLRIVYRKADEELKKEINLWFKEIKKGNYYNNIYIEDLVLSTK